MPKILITGGTGFLGANLVQQLLDSGQTDIRVLAINSPPELAEKVKIIVGSITDRETVADSLAGVEQIYHLAGKVSRNPDDKPIMYQVHVEGTRVLLQEAARAGVERVVMTSTSGTIAVTEDGDPIPDLNAPSPDSSHFTLALLHEQALSRGSRLA